MQRLLEDAQKLSGQEYDISNLNDVYQAIHVVQTEMGITGTTAKEASETISGSFAATKAAFENLMTGMGNKSANMENLMGDLVKSATIAFKNLLPVVKNVFKQIPVLFNGMMPAIIELLPEFLQVGTDVILTLMQGILQSLPALISGISQAVPTIANALIEMSPLLLMAGMDLIIELASGIGQALPQLIPAAVEGILTFAEALLSAPDALIDAAIALIMGLADGLVNALPILIERAPIIIEKLLYAIIDNLPKLAEAGLQLINKLGEGIVTYATNLPAYIGKMWSVLTKAMSDLLGTLLDIGKGIVDNIAKGISDAWGGLVNWFNGLWAGLFGNRKVDVNVSGKDGSHAGGLDYVPYNRYVAELHKGEMVLTSQEADQYRKGIQGGGGITVIQNIYAQPQSPAELMLEAQRQQERAVLFGV